MERIPWHVSYVNKKGYFISHSFDTEKEARHFASIVEGTNITVEQYW